MSDFKEDSCSVLTVMNILAKKWVINIVSELLKEKDVYFSDLQDRLINKYGESISARTLSQALKHLEEAKLCTRLVEKESRRVNYSLTEKGYDLEIILAVMKGFSIKWDDISFKKCQSFSCVHNSVPIINLESIKSLVLIK